MNQAMEEDEERLAYERANEGSVAAKPMAEGFWS